MKQLTVVANSELFKYQRHPLLGKRFGPSLAVVAVEVDKTDVFGLGVKHFVLMENTGGKEVYVGALGEAVKAVKAVYGDVHLNCSVERKKVWLSWHSPMKQQVEK